MITNRLDGPTIDYNKIQKAIDELQWETNYKINNPTIFTKERDLSARDLSVPAIRNNIGKYNQTNTAGQGNYVDYNNSTQINSVADIILTSFNKNMDHYQLFGENQGPLLNILADTVGYVKDYVVKPIIDGDWSAVAMNALMNFSETLDVVANPVKGLIYDGPKGVLNAMGWGPDGRYNYDHDTGNVALDIVLEMVTDPINWATLGTAGIAKTTLVDGGTAAVKAMAGDVANEVAESTLRKIAKQSIGNFLKDGSMQTFENAVEATMHSLGRPITKELKAETTTMMLQNIKKATNVAENYMSVNTLKGLQGITQAGESFERTLLRSSLTVNGVYPSYLALSEGKNFVTRFAQQRLARPAEKLLNEAGTYSIKNYDKVAESIIENTDVLKKAGELTDNTLADKDTIMTVLRDSATRDANNLFALTKKFESDPTELRNAVKEYIEKNHGLSVTDYHAQLTALNKSTNCVFDEAIASVSDVVDVYKKAKYLEEYKAHKEVIDKHTTSTDNYIETIEHITRNLDDIPDDEYNNISSTMLNYNVMDRVSAVYNEIIIAWKFIDTRADTLHSRLVDPVDSMFDNVIKPLFKRTEENLKTLPTNYKETLKPLYKELENNIIVFFNDIRKEIDGVVKEYEKTMDKKKFMLDFSDINFSAYIDDWDMRYSKAITDLEKAMNSKKIGKANTLKKAIANSERSYQDVANVLHSTQQVFEKTSVETIKATLDGAKKEAIPQAYNLFYKTVDIETFYTDLSKMSRYTESEVKVYPALAKEIIDDFLEIRSISMKRVKTEEQHQMVNALYKDRYNAFSKLLHNTDLLLSEINAKGIMEDLTIKTQLDDLLHAVAKVSPSAVENNKLAVSLDGIVYQAKLEQLYTSMQIMDNTELLNFSNDIIGGIGLGKMINDIAGAGTAGDFDETLVSACQNLQYAAKKYHAYRNLFETVYNTDEVSDKVKNAFLSTLQKNGMTPSAYILQNTEKYFDQICDELLGQIHSIEMTRELNLDYFARKYGYVQKHEAASDIDLTGLVMKEELSNHFNNPMVNYLVSDIETTGTDNISNSILELGIKNYSDGTMTDVFNGIQKIDPTHSSNVLPQRSYLNKLYPDMSYEEQITTFLKRYTEGTTEEQVLLDFVQTLQSEIDKGKPVQLVFHNGNRFDVGVIKNRLQYFGLDTTILDRVTIVDTLELLRAKDGFTTIQYAEKEYLRNRFYNYCKTIETLPSGKFIDPCNGALCTHLDNLLHKLDAKKIIPNMKEIEKSVTNLKKSIITNLKSIGETNRELRKIVFSKDMVRNSEEVYDTFLKNRMLVERITKEQAVEKYGRYLNPSKLFYAGNTEANYLGYKKVIDFSLVTGWFQFKPNDLIDNGRAKAYTIMGRSMQHTYNSIRSPHLLKGLEGSIAEAIERIQLSIAKSDSADFLSNIRIDHADVKSQFATAYYLYNSAKNRKLIDKHFLYDINPDVVKYLEDVTPLRKRVYTEQQLTGMAYGSTLNELYTSRADYMEALTDLDLSVNTIDRLCATYNIADATRARKQAQMSCIRDVSALIDASKSFTKLTPEMKDVVVKTQQLYTDNMSNRTLSQIIEGGPELIQNLLATRTPFITFHMNDAINLGLKLDEGALKEFGIVLHKEGDRVYLGLDKAYTVSSSITDDGKGIRNYLNGSVIEPIQLKDVYEDVVSGFGFERAPELMRNAYESIRKLSNDTVVGTAGDLVTRKTHEELLQVLPKSFVNKITTSFMTDANTYSKPLFNLTNLGSYTYRTELMPYASSNVINHYKNSALYLSKQVETKFQYMEMYYDRAMSINGDLFKTLDDNTILTLANSKQFVFSALTADGENVRSVRLMVKNAEDLATARELDAVLMPIHTYSTASQAINTNLFTDKKLKLWNRMMYTYKTGYLCAPGVALRNYIDGTLKNFIETENPTAVIRNQVQALTLIRKYNDCVDNILKMDVGGMFLDENKAFYFSKLQPELDLDTFTGLHNFFMDGAAADLPQVWKQYFAQNGNITDPKSAWQSYVHISSKAMGLNNFVEQVNRLSEYLTFRDMGYDDIKAYAGITKTHFDYGMKSKAEMYAELVIPFYSFTMNNLEYWADAVTTKPWLASMLNDVMTPVWDFDDTDQYELENNASLQYQITSGNLPLGDSGLTLKTSPSFMDPFNLLVNPLSATDKVAAPIKAAFDPLSNAVAQNNEWYKNTFNIYNTESGTGFFGSGGATGGFIDNLPVIGTMKQRYLEQGPKYYERTGNPLTLVLPDTLGATKRYDNSGLKPSVFYESRQQALYDAGMYLDRWKWNNPDKVWGDGTGNGASYRRFTPKKYNKRFSKRVWHRRSYARKSYPKKYYYKHTYQDTAKPRNIYRELYTKTGKSKVALRMLPTSGQTVQHKIRLNWNYIR